MLRHCDNWGKGDCVMLYSKHKMVTFLMAALQILVPLLLFLVGLLNILISVAQSP